MSNVVSLTKHGEATLDIGVLIAFILGLVIGIAGNEFIRWRIGREFSYQRPDADDNNLPLKVIGQRDRARSKHSAYGVTQDDEYFVELERENEANERRKHDFRVQAEARSEDGDEE